MNTDHSNTQMAQAMRRLGFRKSPMQMTRTAITYTHPDAPRVMWSWGKGSGRVMVTGLGRYFPGVRAVLGFASGPALWSVPDITTPSEAARRSGHGMEDRLHPTQREVLLRVARALVAQLEAAAGEE